MEQPATTLSCPKDGSPMRSYERNGVVMDRCTECGGIFLDRGELERLMDAEGSCNDERGRGGDERGGDDDPRQDGPRRRGSLLGQVRPFA